MQPSADAERRVENRKREPSAGLQFTIFFGADPWWRTMRFRPVNEND
jgi:hypothetical protein